MTNAEVLVTPGVVCVFDRPADLLARYEPRFVKGGLFIPNEMRLYVGQQVRLDIVLVGRPVALQILGIVRFKRHNAQEAGVGVEFLSGHRPFFPYLLALGSEEQKMRPRARRFGVELIGSCVFQGILGACRILDLSERGALVLLQERQPLGTRGQIHLELERFGSLVLPVEVRRRSEVPVPGALGLEFVGLEPGQQVELRRLEAFLSLEASRWLAPKIKPGGDLITFRPNS